jgi:uncharacterized protein
MKPRHLILLVLKASGNQLDSKTKLQKLVYFYSQILKINLGYKPHFYGPYSSIVEEGLDELIGAGLVESKLNIYGIDSSSGFERKKFEYNLTSHGIEFAEELSKTYIHEYESIEELLNNLKAMGNPDYSVLSFAAKAYLIIKNEGGKAISEGSIREKMDEFHWKISPSDTQKAVEILENLGFVKKV